jgi:hypothetical protein
MVKLRAKFRKTPSIVENDYNLRYWEGENRMLTVWGKPGQSYCEILYENKLKVNGLDAWLKWQSACLTKVRP